MSGIFRARTIRGDLESYLAHACPMLDDTTNRDIYRHTCTVVRVCDMTEYREMECFGLGVITCKSAIYVPPRT